MNLSLFERARCRICNSVASGEIASDTGEMSHHSFLLEKDGLGFLCSVCDGEVEDAMTDFRIEDQLREDEEADETLVSLEEIYG